MTKDWDGLQEDIRQLYHVENKKLTEVMRIVRGRHAFIASERSYRTQLRKWGYMKYSTQAFPTLRPPKRPKRATSTRAPDASVPGAFLPGHVTGDSLPGIISPFTPPGPSAGPLYFEPSNSLSTVTGPTQPIEYHQGFQGTWSLETVTHNNTIRDSGTQLLLAVIGQDEQEVKRLLFDGASLDTRDRVGNAPLHSAVSGNSEVIVKLLIQYGADVNVKGQLGRTPLHSAVSKATFTHILLREGSDINAQDENGDTPLHLALLESRPKTLNEAKGSVFYDMIQRRCNPDIANKAGLTPFLSFWEQMHGGDHSLFCHLVVHFLRNGSSATKAFPDGRTPLEALMSKVLNRKWCNEGPLADAISHLLEGGADPETLLPSGNPLIFEYVDSIPDVYRYYSDDRSFNLAQTLVKCVSLEETVDAKGDSLLHSLSRKYAYHSTRFDSEKLFRILLQRGADPNRRNGQGETPLFLLLTTNLKDHLVKFKLLLHMLEKGANPWLRDTSGKTPLSVAATLKKSPLKCVQALLKPDWEHLKHQTSYPVDEDESHQDEARQIWRLAAGAYEWNEALARMQGLGFHNSLVEGSTEFCKGACGFLAERHLEMSEKRFEGDPPGNEKRRKYNARVLSDCHRLGIEVDMQHFHDLVELSL